MSTIRLAGAQTECNGLHPKRPGDVGRPGRTDQEARPMNATTNGDVDDGETVDMASESAIECAVKISIELVVSPSWLEYSLGGEIFLTSVCGYWARGVEYDDALGWLVWESDEKVPEGRRAESRRGARRVARGRPAPAGLAPPRPSGVRPRMGGRRTSLRRAMVSQWR